MQAASVRSTVEYLKEVKLFVKKGGTIEDARNWCQEQNDNWQVFDGDFNAGSAAKLTREVGVFLCYQTTTDPDEAITDLAVMNETGRYSEADYKIFLNKQKEYYMDIVNNMSTMLDEYRKNYKNKIEMAVIAHDHLNNYIEDDSGELLGDFLLTVDDETLAGVLLQSNGMVFLDMEQTIASACDTAKTTWLDRMAKLGSFDKLKDAFSKNMSSGNVTKALNKKYNDKANKLLTYWDDISMRIADIKNFAVNNGLEGATEDQYNEWLDNLSISDDNYYSYQELLLLSSLSMYKYGDKTLYDFFAKTKKQVEKEGIEILYPMAACLTEGQFSALDSGIGLYQLLQDALAATIVNDSDVGLAKELNNEDKQNPEEAKTKQSHVEEAKELITAPGNEAPLSIYEGVDKDMFKEGVAVTSEAQKASAGSKQKWNNGFYNGMCPEDAMITYIGVTLGIGLIATGVIFTQHAMYNSLISSYAPWYTDGKFTSAADLLEAVKDGDEFAEKALDQIELKISTSEAFTKEYTAFFLGGIKWISCLAFILMSVYDIVCTIHTIKNYYNIEHISIPGSMVSLSYSETKDASYVAYKSVRDQNGDYGDLNGDGGFEWLALYYTRDKNAGNPILAPTEKGKEMLLVNGTAEKPEGEYSPLYLFGTPNVAQNLTYADGKKGWSYRDTKNGTYFYFKHAEAVVSYADSDDDAALAESQTGTALASGTLALVGIAGIAVGGFIGFVIANTRRRKDIRQRGKKD